MGLEIERKYRISSLGDLPLPPGEDIEQAYLATGDITVRVRVKSGRAMLTIKCAAEPGTSAQGAIVCQEFEYPVPMEDARQLIRATSYRIIKTRHRLPGGIELDVFHDRHEGLIMAEFESEDGGQAPCPRGVAWVEVSEDRRYSNAWMAMHGIPPA